jgi:hypothetical protein
MALALAAMVATTTAAHATAIAITPSPTGDSYQIAGSNLSGWTNSSNGYNFVFNTATSAVNTGPQNGLEMDSSTANNGGSVIALDADYLIQPVTNTTLTGLSLGVMTLTFNFAGDQQENGSDGCTSSICGGNYDALLAVTLGGVAATSGTNDGTLLDAAKGATSGDTTTGLGVGGNCNNAGVSPCILSQEWSGWESETLTFNVTSATETLSFLASANVLQPQVPAFALVDNLSYTVATPPPGIPEPNSLLLLSTGLLGLGGYMRMRYKSGVAAKA